MSERIQVKRDGEHRGWVSYVGVNVVTSPFITVGDGVDFVDEWLATKQKLFRVHGVGDALSSTTVVDVDSSIHGSREEAIRWLVEEETCKSN